ncbi:hypothetical protein SAMN03097699_0575 [Flavobacteriaceae bacterium MAR_2010_188]|nr:hypothetical protein SAMN03097699_0575 [Flavobacteriaceae bacterium MAR_2010_188]
MKTKRVATLYARKFKSTFRNILNRGSILLLSSVILLVSCSKGDDVETVGEISPIDNRSQIIYTDIEPDYTSEHKYDFYELDLNNDLFIDFTLRYRSDDYWEMVDILEITSTNAGNGIISISPWYSNPVPLDSDREIFNLSGYSNGEAYESWGFFTIGDCFGGDTSCYLDWKDKNDKFLGLRFIVDGKTHFGWARLSLTSPTDWVLKDYAFNATPNKPILAGQME